MFCIGDSGDLALLAARALVDLVDRPSWVDRLSSFSSSDDMKGLASFLDFIIQFLRRVLGDATSMFATLLWPLPKSSDFL